MGIFSADYEHDVILPYTTSVSLKWSEWPSFPFSKNHQVHQTNMSQQRSDSKGDVSPSSPRDADYPPQLHAGAVGLGPEFGKGAVRTNPSLRAPQILVDKLSPVQTIGEKIDGMKEEIKGKVKHDPELVQHGRDQRTGELKRKEMRNVGIPCLRLRTALLNTLPIGPRWLWSAR